MVWLLAISGAVTLAIVVFTAVITVAALRSRRGRRSEITKSSADGVASIRSELPPGDEDADLGIDADADAEFVQYWLDNEWERRFG